ASGFSSFLLHPSSCSRPVKVQLDSKCQGTEGVGSPRSKFVQVGTEAPPCPPEQISTSGLLASLSSFHLPLQPSPLLARPQPPCVLSNLFPGASPLPAPASLAASETPPPGPGRAPRHFPGRSSRAP